ncbi:MAG TPA: type VI secretion system baseplate subunit TssG [Ignavibacteriaceae bacterium]|nr:type VI secretion system baseplate subunit TssG [Ignavibacteriaceae bacterium]
MADELRENYSGIKDDLLRNGPAYNIWQAVLIGENISRKEFKNSSSEAAFDDPLLKFKPYENYEYPPRDIKKIFYNDGFLNFVLTFMGLYGINSPLPRCYHDQVAVQQRILGSGEVPLQNFLDIFNNRFYWLYYQAWKKYRFYLHINGNTENKIAERINSFTGISRTAHPLNKLSKFFLLKFSGILSLRVRSKSGLMLLLWYVFPEYTMKIREFVLQWIQLSDIPGLGQKECRLGINVFIGNAAQDYSGRIALEIGPIDFENYMNFLPGNENSDKLIELLNIYLNDGLEYNFEFIIKSETIVAVAWDDERLKLGTSVWLGKPQTEYVKVNIPYEEIIRNKSQSYPG